MSEARAEVLGRIREALGSGNGRERSGVSLEVPREYLFSSGLSHQELVKQFVERVSEYRATVYRTTTAALRRRVLEVCRLHGVKTLVVPPDVPEGWLPPGLEFIRDETLSNDQLSAMGGVLSGCALAVAQTGTLVLDGGEAQGRRALTLLPDLHLCVVFAQQIVGTVPEAVAALSGTATRPLTLISGPSATSDIELSRVEGVHGPRTLEILLVEEP